MEALIRYACYGIAVIGLAFIIYHGWKLYRDDQARKRPSTFPPNDPDHTWRVILINGEPFRIRGDQPQTEAPPIQLPSDDG